MRWRQRAAPMASVFPGTVAYWQQRYLSGRTSGAGSYGELAQFKAQVLNRMVEAEHIRSVVEFGCGDGHQLSLARYPTYVGLDVSSAAIDLCLSRFAGDPTKSFLWYDPARFRNNGALGAEMAVSLDVVFHLVEDDLFASYMHHLFAAAERLVVIYSSDAEMSDPGAHVRHRHFTPWVAQHVAGWRLRERIDNPLRGADSPSDFFIYEQG